LENSIYNSQIMHFVLIDEYKYNQYNYEYKFLFIRILLKLFIIIRYTSKFYNLQNIKYNSILLNICIYICYCALLM